MSFDSRGVIVRRHFISLLLIHLAGCGGIDRDDQVHPRVEQRVGPQQLAGCYKLDVAEWSVPNPDAYLPAIIKLDTILIVYTGVRTTAERWDEYVARPTGGASTASWHPFSPTRFSVMFSGERGAIGIVATVNGDEIHGNARGTFDANHYPEPKATVTGVRIQCPASLN